MNTSDIIALAIVLAYAIGAPIMWHYTEWRCFNEEASVCLTVFWPVCLPFVIGSEIGRAIFKR